MRAVEKQVLLQEVDMRWREHLWHLDHLRSVIHLRGYAQRDPLNEFKNEAFTLFERMLLDLRTTRDAHADARPVRAGAAGRRRPGDAGRRAPQQISAPRLPPARLKTAAGRPRPAQSRLGLDAAQRPLPVRLGQALQELPRRRERAGAAQA